MNEWQLDFLSLETQNNALTTQLSRLRAAAEGNFLVVELWNFCEETDNLPALRDYLDCNLAEGERSNFDQLSALIQRFRTALTEIDESEADND